MNSTLAAPARLEIPVEPYISWMPDSLLAAVLPVAFYWALSGFYFVLDHFELAEKYRLHTPLEVTQKNKCSMKEVVRAVLMQQAIQVAAGAAPMLFEKPDTRGHEAYEIWKIGKNLGVGPQIAGFLYNWAFPTVRMFFAFFLIDTWQYALHRFMHTYQWAYKRWHSVHHRLYVPYAFGALYNSLFEGFLLDTAGAFIAGLVSGMTNRELIVLYCFSTIKTVDDHCGYDFPWDPLQWLFPNRATYHDIHHQQFGIKTNFSQPYFVHWDLLLGTKYPKTEEYIESHRIEREAIYEKAQKAKAE